MQKKQFAAVITCMDGRVQLPVSQYLRERFKVDYVDTITEPGPVGLLAQKPETSEVQGIWKRLEISIYKHHAGDIAVVAHEDCAGNPVSQKEQMVQLEKSVDLIKSKYDSLRVIGLWVNDQWQVQEVFS